MKGLSRTVTASLLGLALTSCIPSLKSSFVESSYPSDMPPARERNWTLTVDAAVSPSLTVAYERPAETGDCLARLAASPTARASLWNYGACTASGKPLAACAAALPWVAPKIEDGAAPADADLHCPMRLSALDRVRLTVALSEAADALYAHHLAAFGRSALGGALTPEMDAAFARALAHAAELTKLFPRSSPRPGAPALALSGGAANGAFIAGWLHALLWTREKARFHANGVQRAAIDGYRFGSVAASSVGTLVGLPLDLYFSERAPNAIEAAALDRCIQTGGGTVSGLEGRKVQDCALARLEQDFVVNEWDLLCAQKGSVLSVVHDDFGGFLRFDPLEERVLRPFLRDFRSLVLENGFLRTAMAVDMDQNVLVGLDERACRLAGMNTDRCLIEGVLASIVEPVFVPSRKRVFSGLEGARGESGTWLDGSIRSLNPVARAATYTTGRVLALNTHRAGAVPSGPPQGAMPLLLSTFDALGASQRSWEVQYASLYHEDRRRRICDFRQLLEGAAPCSAHDAEPLPEPVLSVWVPEDVRPKVLSASGYTFDPLVMKGLFLWGAKDFFRSRARVLGWLDWCVLNAMERASACDISGVSPSFVGDIERRVRAIDAELAQYQKYDDRRLWQEHVDERRKVVQQRMKTCR